MKKKLLFGLPVIILLVAAAFYASGIITGKSSETEQKTEERSIRELADEAGIMVGVRAFLKNQQQEDLVEKEFNTATRTCYPNSINKTPKTSDLESFNYGVNWLYARGMKPMHHMLFGPTQYEAAWVKEKAKDFTEAELESMMKERIRVIMETNGNAQKVNVWNVVNEALSWNKGEEGKYFSGDMVLWAKMGYEDDKSGLSGEDKINDQHPVFISKAFTIASQYARGKLELRENTVEHPCLKAKALYQLVKHLQNSGVKIDAVGFQCHYGMDSTSFDPEGLATEIRKFKELGIEVYLDEVDFGRNKLPWTPELAETQKQMYKTLMTVALNEGVSQVHFWGLKDNDENWRGDENPLLFDENLKPKPAYYGVKEALAEYLAER